MTSTSIYSNSTSCGSCYGAAFFDEIIAGTANISGKLESTSTYFIAATPFAFASPGLVTILPLPQTTTINPASLSGLSIIWPVVYFVISEYSVISTVISRGTCSSVAGLPSTTGPFSFTVGPLSQIPSVGFKPPLTSVAQGFAQQIGISCLTSSNSSRNTITSREATLQSSSTVAPGINASATTTRSVTSQASTSIYPTLTIIRSNPGTKVGTGVGVSFATLILTMLGLLLWRQERRRAQKASPVKKSTRKPRRRWRAYFQDKGELDAEEQRRNELENSEIRHEMAFGERHELAVEETRQELRGDDNIQELR